MYLSIIIPVWNEAGKITDDIREVEFFSEKYTIIWESNKLASYSFNHHCHINHPLQSPLPITDLHVHDTISRRFFCLGGDL